MKKLITILITICIISITQAATITVSNNPNSPGQFTNLQWAIDSAQSGDVILVAGSNTTYGNIYIYKNVHLKGVGFNPDKQMSIKAEIASCNFASQGIGLSSSGSSIEGFKVTNNINISGDPTMVTSNITIQRNDIYSVSILSYVSNVNIFNNKVSDISKPGNHYQVSNIIISNNIISIITFGSNSSPSSIPTNISAINNIFINNTTISPNINVNFSNNIFFTYSPFSTGLSYCTFLNNLSFNTPNNAFNTSGTNSGANNIVNQDPLFVNETNNSFDNTDDYHFPSTSPAYNAGSDGTDIGIYGGAYPWPDGGISGGGFMYSQEPAIPQVNQMNITTTVVPVGGNLTVTAKGITNP